MVTTQIIQRQFFGKTLRQNHHTQYLCANDILEIGNYYRKTLKQPLADMRKYIDAKKTQEFLHALMKREQVAQPIIRKKGRNGDTYMHPFVALDFMMWISPDFKVEAIKIIYDSLCIFRDKSGDSYKKMCSAIDKYLNLPPSKLSLSISYIARMIKEKLNVTDWNCATQEQLEKRDKIHRDIELLIEAGIEPIKALEVVIKRY